MAKKTKKKPKTKDLVKAANNRAKKVRAKVPGIVREAQYVTGLVGVVTSSAMGFVENQATKIPTLNGWDPRLVYGGAALGAGVLIDLFNAKDKRMGHLASGAMRGVATGLLAAASNRMAATLSVKNSKVATMEGYPEVSALGPGYMPPQMTAGPAIPAPAVSGYGYGGEIFSFDDNDEDDEEVGEL